MILSGLFFLFCWFSRYNSFFGPPTPFRMKHILKQIVRPHPPNCQVLPQRRPFRTKITGEEKKKYRNYCIVQNARRRQFCDAAGIREFMKENLGDIRNKKLITITPGGFNGYYMLGVSTYIKTFLNVSSTQYVFTGASAGAWNALVFAYRGEPYTLFPRIREIIQAVNRDFKESSISRLHTHMRELILEKFRDDEFDFTSMYVGVTVLSAPPSLPFLPLPFLPLPFLLPKIKTVIYTDFENLRDAVDGCIASSHVPFITGDGHHATYRGAFSFDGGFSKTPFLATNPEVFRITPEVWVTKTPAGEKSGGIEAFTTLLSKHKYDLVEMFERGFVETFENQDELRRIFSGADDDETRI